MGRGFIVIVCRCTRSLGLFATLIAAGCAAIPPESADHARALAAYHRSTAEATLAAFDALTAALDHALDRVRDTTDGDWAGYIDDTTDAAHRFAQLQTAAADSLALLPSTPAGDDAPDPHAALRARLTTLRDTAAAGHDLFDSYARTASATRTADLRAFLEHQRITDRAAADLHAEIAAHHTTLARELDRQTDLFDSYLTARSAPLTTLGPRAQAALHALTTASPDSRSSGKPTQQGRD